MQDHVRVSHWWLRQVENLSLPSHMVSWNMHSVQLNPLKDGIEVPALVVRVEVGERDLPSRYPVISGDLMVNWMFSMPCNTKTHEMTPTSALHIKFCLIISMQWSTRRIDWPKCLSNKSRTIPRWLRMNSGRVLQSLWISGYWSRYVDFRSMFYELNIRDCLILFTGRNLVLTRQCNWWKTSIDPMLPPPSISLYFTFEGLPDLLIFFKSSSDILIGHTERFLLILELQARFEW